MSNLEENQNKLQIVESPEYTEIKEEGPSTSGMSGDRPQKRAGRRPGRRSSKMDVRAKLERSRQSARECRARKKLRYQYLEDLVANREKAVFALRDELEMYKQWCIQIDSGLMPMSLLQIADNEKIDELEPKRRRMDKITENDNDSLKSTWIEEQSGSTENFKGNNFCANIFTKGDNQFEHSASSVESAAGSSMDDLIWKLEGDMIRIEPRTRNSVLRGTNCVLPTIVEESEK
ncbi:uncharacterized protein LOC123540809 [Mercenaria mercenaria]|uniref:uncharacterized protein LOC123540809 n=1 Tax=Mercenaria mercenaria TaxID=6596 RepID=UPI00234F4817|nr:uncharacterized protein LOC123540809 [Mercenaria mercenaria]